MASVKVVIRALTFNHFNQRIGCCLQVILITWLLWQPIHCNRNRVIGGNHETKIYAKQLTPNGFDPLPTPYQPYRPGRSATRSYGIRSLSKQTNRSSNLDNYNLNYLLSVLQEDERQAIFRNSITNQRSDTSSDSTQTLVSNSKKDDSVPKSDIELAAEERKDIQDKLSLFSSSLNVIDVSPQDTQLAHSVLIIHKPKPNKTITNNNNNNNNIKVSNNVNNNININNNKNNNNNNKPTIAPQLLTAYPIRTNTKFKTKSPVVQTITNAFSTSTTTTTTEDYGTPVRNNHRHSGSRPFMGLRAKPTTTTPAAISVVTTRTTPSTTTIYSENLSTDLQTFNTTLTTIEESEDFPVIFNNNHKKQSFPMFTRKKLTTTEFTLISTTPESIEVNDKTEGMTEVPTVLSTSYTFRPPYMTTIYNQKRPPMKIMTVNANKVKPPDDIFSEGITVLDPPFLSGHPMKLPPNTTIIHKNLIVPMKEGRPKPVYPMSSTTQFPIYPMLGGITSWHTTPTTPWVIPLVTTTAPEKIYEAQQQLTSTVGDPNEPVTSESVNRPTIIAGQPLISTVTSGQTSHLVTVTPIKSTSHPNVHSNPHSASSNVFVVTQSAQTARPSTSTTGYVNAIWAPPMPIARPVQAVQPVATSWWSPFSNIFSVDPSSGSMFSFMNVMKTVMFTILVFFLPPLTLAAALMQTAIG